MSKFKKEFVKLIRDTFMSEGLYSINKILGFLGSLVLLYLSVHAILIKHDYSETVLITVFSTLLVFISTMFGLRTVNLRNILKFKSDKNV